MSAAGLSAAASALWPTLRRVLLRLGRWVLIKLIEIGAPWLCSFMASRIAKFSDRRKAWAYAATHGSTEASRRHARITRRRLDRRIARWRWAAGWISQNATRLKLPVLRQFEALAGRIPETPWWERGE